MRTSTLTVELPSGAKVLVRFHWDCKDGEQVIQDGLNVGAMRTIADSLKAEMKRR